MQKRGLAILFATIYILMNTFSVSFADTDNAGSGAEIVLPDTGTADPNTEIKGRGAASRVPAPEISAPSAMLMEAETGQILYEKNIEAPLHISAANKLMTVLVAVENSNLTSYVTASSDSVNTEGSTLNLIVGEKYLMNDLLHAVMLTSANDAATAVA